MELLNPKGLIAAQELTLMWQASALMLIVMIAVFALLFYFAWTYRASNTRATYLPNWEHAKMDELIWWAIPFEIVLVLGALTYTSTRDLDPKKEIISATAPIEVQVVALPWKWLFIYENGVASVNELYLPTNTPVTFSITADAPMNSFWIPALGGQIYAMPGMVTKLNLLAYEAGEYQGLSANYSGEGFAQMKFAVHTLPRAEFDAQMQEAARDPDTLSWAVYERMSQPSTSSPEEYGSSERAIFERIVSQFSH